MRFAELYSRGWPVAWSAARALLPCDAAADDAVQQVFLGLWDQGPDAWREDLPDRYFERAGRNQAQKWLARRSRNVPLPEPGSRVWVSADRRPDELMVRAQRAQFVREALQVLPKRCRTVMELLLDEDLTNREIADRLGVGVGAVEKQKARACRLLRKELDGTLGEDTSEMSLFEDGGGETRLSGLMYTLPRGRLRASAGLETGECCATTRPKEGSMVRDLALKAFAIAVIALAGMASSASADPDEPCTSDNYGDTYCEGCNVCYAQGYPYRMSKWTCEAGWGWSEEVSGYYDYEDCNADKMLCGASFEN